MNTEIESEIIKFTKNVAKLRKKHNLSKTRMCNILKTSIHSLNKIEKGIIPKKLSLEVVFRIENHFGITPKDQFSKNI